MTDQVRDAASALLKLLDEGPLHAGKEDQCAACGAASGPVCQVVSAADLERVGDGAVVVAAHPFPGLVTVMGKASAIVTEVGGVCTKHLADIDGIAATEWKAFGAGGDMASAAFVSTIANFYMTDPISRASKTMAA